MLAIRMYVEGNSYRAITRILKVNPHSVVNWVKSYTAKLPNTSVPKRPKVAELDELFTYVGQKKNEIYVLTVVDRETHCVLSWDAIYERTSERLQACLERGPQARQYFIDAFPAYITLYYGVLFKRHLSP